MSFEAVEQFENKIAEFFGSRHAVATDSCTHAIELCLRHRETKTAVVPSNTYISVPFTLTKLGIDWSFNKNNWHNYYWITDDVIDAAVFWQKNSFIANALMCLSFQFKKHLGLGRGGMILTDSKDDYLSLKKMSYDGRLPDTPWAEQDINTIGYHYYMTPETAQNGLNKLEEAIQRKPKSWNYKDYPDLRKMSVFK